MAYEFDVVVVGGGAAGLTAAGLAASFGAKTMMVERDRLGGDCTWTGCVPSKTLIKAAKVVHQARAAHRYGLTDLDPDVPFERVMRHVRTVRDEVYHEADRPEIYEEMGIDVRFGRARLTSPHLVEIEGKAGTERVSSRYIALATGGRAAVPPIPGLEEVDYLTNESLFEIDAQPASLVVLGAGPIGIEMAQAFRRLASDVTVVDRADRILGRDDAEHAALLQDVLHREGISFVLGASVERVAEEDGQTVVHVSVGGEQRTLRADRLLVATGRRPNIENLGLVEAGVTFTEQGIQVDDKCRTSQDHIYAVGDCTGEYQLTHMSEHMAKVAMSNAVLKVPSKIDRAHVPWCTFADPEVAQLGATEAELKERGVKYEVYRFPYSKLDRALTENETVGQIKVFATKWRGKILGASVLGDRAGELVSLYAVAMKNGVSLRQIADTIHPYPTYGLGARRAADQWYARKQFPVAIKAVQKLFGYRGPAPQPVDPERIV
jgi:pyruvate/2-oxoglutarate dehydrogenase complex dihydrolipoamide dehydrogenase (E3) component